jgi:hypothetical protein
LGYLFGNSCFIWQEKNSSQNLLRCKHCELKTVIWSQSIVSFQTFLPRYRNQFSSLILLHHFLWMIYTLPLHSLTWQLNYKQCNRNEISTASATNSVTDNSTLWLEVSWNYDDVTLWKTKSFYCYCKCRSALIMTLNSKWLKHNTAGSGDTHHIPTIFYYYSLHMVNTDHNPSPHRLMFQHSTAMMAQKMLWNSPTSSKMVSTGNLLCLFSLCIEVCGAHLFYGKQTYTLHEQIATFMVVVKTRNGLLDS